jgi:catalase
MGSEPNQLSDAAPVSFGGAGLVLRLLVIAVVIAVIAGLFLDAGGWIGSRKLTPARFVDGFEQVFGVHAGFRRNHAKGVDVSGYFESSGQRADISKASVFLAGRLPVVGRFSLGGGKPYAADAAQSVRGLGILFQLPHGEEWRTAMVNLPVFPFRTPQAFYEQLLASAPDPATGKPDPAKMKLFLEQHPESASAIQLIRSQKPASGFDDTTFNSLNSFRFVNSLGETASVRWSLIPVQSSNPAQAESVQQSDTNYLFDGLIAAIHKGPLQWRLILTVAGPGDPSDDATIPWPPDRRKIDAGILTLDHIESDDTGLARDINFDPLVLPNGISASDDPLLSARSAVYSQDFTRREGEHKEPSPISAAETGK